MGRIPIFWDYVARKIFDISGISEYDWVYLSANYYSLLTGEQDQDANLKARGYSPEQIKFAKQKKQAVSTTVGPLRFTRPTIEFKYPNISYVLTLFQNYEKGLLPFPGSVSEQPAQIMEVFNLLRNIRNDYQQKLNTPIEVPKHGRLNKDKSRAR